MNDSLRTVNGRSVLRMERRLAHPQEKVWRAITEPAHLAKWFPFKVEMDLQLDAKISFIEHEGDAPALHGVITELDPPRVFAFSWDDDHLHWELRAEAGGCLLTLTHTFDDRAGAASFASGWHTCIEAMDAMLAGRTIEAPSTMAELATQHEERVAEFGLADGSAEETADGWLVRFERQLTQPIDAVWAMLTGSAPAAVGDQPPAGCTAAGIPAGPITALDPPTALEYEGQDGRIRWELRDGTGHGARLVLTHHGPPDHSAALAAWKAHIERLAADVAAGAGR
jgi:uncharacterized protein YndB with AHSA1/START domain